MNLILDQQIHDVCEYNARLHRSTPLEISLGLKKVEQRLLLATEATHEWIFIHERKEGLLSANDKCL